MKTQHTTTQWYSADRMHEMTKTWLSELHFINDEQLFLEDLISDYSQKISNDDIYIKAQNAATALQRTKRGNHKLITDLTTHENQLSIMVDGIDQLDKEQQYKTNHVEFTKTISQFFYDYKAVKFEIFKLVKDLMKTDKQDPKL
ncbi:hypothetical protein [uncultured Olleya sp.]|uniref:hypothetical protein n=1 Tax=uncultured Olleya sp. TaxID=757243 RepID=UPI00259AD6CE|nr:hypothetical protein [uncultured Olleya sp.]